MQFISAIRYQKFILTLVMSYIASIFLGYLVARKGLRPIIKLEQAIDEITATALHERINLHDWPKELTHVAEKFNHMLDRLQTSFTQLCEFSSDIAHELRTPLHNLRGITELALSKPDLSDAYRGMLEKYMHEYQHLSKLIENLLFLARADHGQLPLKKTPIDLRQMVLDIYDYYQAMADEQNIRLVCIGGSLICVDPPLFKRVMVNLISNAFKYTPSDGEIRVNIQVHAQAVAIEIADTGCGIPPEHLVHLFDRFYRVPQTDGSNTSGIGLGLAIIKSILNAHSGSINIHSQLGVGTTVSIRLPGPNPAAAH